MHSFTTLARTAGHSRRRGRLAGGAATIVAALLGAIAVTPAPAGAAGAAASGHCLQNVDTQRLDCYHDFRAAMAAATGGQVADAPEDAGALDARTIARIAAAGEAASSNRAAGAKSAASNVLSIMYDEANYTGDTVSLTSNVTCARGRTIDVNFVADWNNRVSSFRNVSDCASYYYLDAKQKGSFTIDHAHDGGRRSLPSGFDNQISSVHLFEGPSAKEVIEMCGLQSSICTFPGAEVTEFNEAYHEVKRVEHCSDLYGETEVNWSETRGGVISLGVEVTAAAEFSAASLATLSAGITASFGREWNWSKTVSDKTTIKLEPWSWATFERSPRMQRVKGMINVRTANSHYGRSSWGVNEFDGIVESQSLGQERTRGALMTDEERALCPPSARSQRLPESVVVNRSYNVAG